MAPTNQIFISFALKDINFRDLLVEQLSNKETLYSFVNNPGKQFGKKIVDRKLKNATV